MAKTCFTAQARFTRRSALRQGLLSRKDLLYGTGRLSNGDPCYSAGPLYGGSLYRIGPLYGGDTPNGRDLFYGRYLLYSGDLLYEGPVHKKGESARTPDLGWEGGDVGTDCRQLSPLLVVASHEIVRFCRRYSHCMYIIHFSCFTHTRRDESPAACVAFPRAGSSSSVTNCGTLCGLQGPRVPHS